MTLHEHAPSLPRHALIVGHGRSGSNWVLSMLNGSGQVHARNEPHLLSGSPYRLLPPAEQTVRDPLEVGRSWDAFIRWTCERDGERDPRSPVAKDFDRRWARRTGASSWPVRPKVRRGLAVVSPALRRAEWRPPRWLADRSAHAAALHVLKLNDLRFWHAGWVLRERPQVPVVHLVRHPGGYLHSAWTRFFGPLDEGGRQAEEDVYRGALAESMQVSPRWRERVGEVSELPLDEAVLWFWRVNNEEIHEAGEGRPAYRCVRYEDFTSDPLQVARELYHHVGVPWTPTAEAAVRDGLDQSVWGPVSSAKRDLAEGWQQSLAPHRRELAERVLADSPMSSWW